MWLEYNDRTSGPALLRLHLSSSGKWPKESIDEVIAVCDDMTVRSPTSTIEVTCKVKAGQALMVASFHMQGRLVEKRIMLSSTSNVTSCDV